MKKIIIGIFLMFVLLISFADTAFAIQDYEGVTKINASLEINSAGIADCSASVRARSGYSIDLLMELQQYQSTGWETIKDWKTNGTIVIQDEKSWPIYSGYEYRVLATATVYDFAGNLVEEVPYASNVVQY